MIEYQAKVKIMIEAMIHLMLYIDICYDECQTCIFHYFEIRLFLVWYLRSMSFIYDKKIRKFCEWEKNIDNTFVPKPQISYNIENRK